jgi:hypothetical protein
MTARHPAGEAGRCTRCQHRTAGAAFPPGRRSRRCRLAEAHSRWRWCSSAGHRRGACCSSPRRRNPCSGCRDSPRRCRCRRCSCFPGCNRQSASTGGAWRRRGRCSFHPGHSPSLGSTRSRQSPSSYTQGAQPRRGRGRARGGRRAAGDAPMNHSVVSRGGNSLPGCAAVGGCRLLGAAMRASPRTLNDRSGALHPGDFNNSGALHRAGKGI